METTKTSCSLVVIISGLGLLAGCNEAPPVSKIPLLSDTEVSEITVNSAVLKGLVLIDGDEPVTERGFTWSTGENPGINGSKLPSGVGAGSFSGRITGLEPDTEYSVRTYASTLESTYYGNARLIRTPATVTEATVHTRLPDNVTSTSVFTGGEVADIGGGEITERGICWNTEPEPTTEHFKMLSGTGSGHFTLLLTGLQPGITYYLRAYAINSAGVSYGPEMVFRTLAILGNRMTSFPGETIYHSVLFSIEDKIYMGLGAPDEWDWSPSTDMWEWDQGTGRWRELSAFPVDYSLAAGFAVGGKGYVLASVWSETEGKEVSEFWEFDPAINAWNRKSPIPAGASWLKTAKFSIGNKGYVGLNNNQLWEWDQATDTWTRKADYHVAGRNGAATFVIGNTGYLCGGYATGNEQMILTDLWEYHQASDTWTRKADFPGVPRYSAIGFSIAAKGYVGAGQTSNDPDYEMQDFWAWDQASDEWTRLGAVASSDEVFTGGSVGANGFFLSYAWENVLKIELWTFPMIPENKRSGLQQIPAMPD